MSTPTDSLPCAITGREALAALLTRRSAWPLVEPAPSDDELNQIFELALRAPDHGAMRPWRFAVIRGDARAALAQVFVDAALARDAAADVNKVRRKVVAAPLTIALAVQLRESPKVPEIEQLMSGAAASMNLLNGLHLLGYSGFWSTGANSADDAVRRALGFADDERLIGFMYVGTSADSRPLPKRPAAAEHVREWTHPA